MSLENFALGANLGPFTVSLSVGGGLPYSWDLWVYERDDGPPPRYQGSGRGVTPQDIHALEPGQAICWSVAAVNLGKDSQTAKLVATLFQDGKVVGSPVTASIDIAPDVPNFFVTVGVVT